MGTSKEGYEMEAVKVTVRDEGGTGKTAKKGRCGGGDVGNKRSVQIGIWLFLVANITFTPVMMKFSFWGVGREVLPDKYAPPTVHTFSFLISLLLGLGITMARDGMTGIWKIFNVRAILLLAPVSIGYAASEALALFAMRSADPIMYAVIHKMRLLETAAMTRIFLRRKISMLQWVICLTVTCCVLAFVLFTVNQGGGQRDVLGPLLLVLNITVSVACSIYADWSYKKIGYALPVQIPTGRITASAGSALIGILFISVKGWWQFGWFGGPQGGWDYKVVLLMLYNVVRDWTTCFVLLYLDALWKALAGSAAVSTTYIADVLIFHKQFHPTLFCLVLGIMLAVAIYALVKLSEKSQTQIVKENATLKAKLAQLATQDSPNSDATAVRMVTA